MSSSKSKYLQHLNDIMVKTYLALRETGTRPDGRDKYINGFLDSGLLSELVTNEETQAVIDAANLRVFGVNIEEREQFFKNVESTYPDFIDVPTMFRKGKVALMNTDLDD